MSSKKILICDDEPGMRESFKLILGEQYDLILTENGQQCLECLKNNTDVKLVLLDIKIPQAHGLDILQTIKQQFPQINVIMVTGYQSVEMASEASRRGADGYIIKPFKSSDILEAVEKRMK